MPRAEVAVSMPSEGGDLTGDGASEEATYRYVRSPEDVLRVIVFAAISLLLLSLTVLAEDAIVGLENDLLELFSGLPSAMLKLVTGVSEVIALSVGVGVYLLAMTTRRWRLVGYVALASVTTFAVMSGIDAVIDSRTDVVVDNILQRETSRGDSLLDGVVQLSQLSAMFVVVAPFVSRRWRHAGLVVIAPMTLLQVLVSAQLPVDLLLALPVGATVATGVLLALGRPDRRPTLRAISAALDASGLPPTALAAANVDARGSTPYFATLADGTRVFVKVLGAHERAADLMFRVYRFLRLKDVGDDRPFSSLRRAVEHEALVALLARDIGVRTPRLRAVASVGADSMLLAYDMIAGSSLDGVPDEGVTDDVMRAVWQQIAMLRSHGIAHRDLRRANVFVEAGGTPWIIDFGFSEIAVPSVIHDADVAQMLASFAVVVGEERAVTAAIGVLGADAVAAALPRLQVRALSGATQSALKRQPGLLARLQSEVSTRCGTSGVQLADLERFDRKRLFTVALLMAVTYFLFPQLADLPDIAEQVRDADWRWAPLVLIGSAMTYVAASASLAGAIPQRIRTGPLVMSSVGSSFASKLAPAGVGGMALNVRFLQKQGVDEPVAVSAIGLNTVAGLAGHLGLVAVFIVWAGPNAFGSFRLPEPKWFLVAIGVVLVLLVIALLVPATRTLLRDRLLPVLQRAFDGVTDVLRRPGKVAMLVGGSMLVTFSYLSTLYFSTQAFGGGLPFATVGAVYLVGSAVATAAPTPGGLGAMEAALIGGLVAAGLDSSIAVPAVFLYRLATFWVPILPGWLCFQWLQRHEYV